MNFVKYIFLGKKIIFFLFFFANFRILLKGKFEIIKNEEFSCIDFRITGDFVLAFDFISVDIELSSGDFDFFG
jgi:hypothetical protein